MLDFAHVDESRTYPRLESRLSGCSAQQEPRMYSLRTWLAWDLDIAQAIRECENAPKACGRGLSRLAWSSHKTEERRM